MHDCGHQSLFSQPPALTRSGLPARIGQRIPQGPGRADHAFPPPPQWATGGVYRGVADFFSGEDFARLDSKAQRIYGLFAAIL